MGSESVSEETNFSVRRLELQLKSYDYLEDFLIHGRQDQDIITGALSMTCCEFINGMNEILAYAPEKISTLDLMNFQVKALRECVVDISKIITSLQSKDDKLCN